MTDRRIDWLAIAIGAVTDTVGTIAFMFLFGVVAAFASEMQHLSSSEMEARLQRPVMMIALMIIGLSFTVLGGYVAGRVSKVNQVMHGGIVGSIGIILVLLFWNSAPVWNNIVSLVTTVPCGLLGGWLAGQGKIASLPDQK
jgi:small-conductance mechanosensitive channel